MVATFLVHASCGAPAPLEPKQAPAVGVMHETGAGMPFADGVVERCHARARSLVALVAQVPGLTRPAPTPVR